MTDLSLFQTGATLAAASGHGCPAHLTYFESGVVGLIQGVTELFPVSSLGHNVLLPALVGGCWARDLNVAATESPYLAFIVGLHVATAIALLIYFWQDWIRIIRGFFSSIGHFARPEPEELLYDEIEAVWAAIADGDDWSRFHAKLAAIEAAGRAWAFEPQGAVLEPFAS